MSPNVPPPMISPLQCLRPFSHFLNRGICGFGLSASLKKDYRNRKCGSREDRVLRYIANTCKNTSTAARTLRFKL